MITIIIRSMSFQAIGPQTVPPTLYDHHTGPLDGGEGITDMQESRGLPLPSPSFLGAGSFCAMKRGRGQCMVMPYLHAPQLTVHAFPLQKLRCCRLLLQPRPIWPIDKRVAADERG